MIRFFVCVAAALALAVTMLAADASGTWTASFDTQVGNQTYTYTFKVDGAKLTGATKSNLGEGTIAEGMVDGNNITFIENMTYQGMPLRIQYKGTLKGDEISFKRTVVEGTVEEFVAKRSK
jgi:hypothetical protein